MYLARFSYDVLPANRQKAIEFIRREVAAAREKGLGAKLLVPITRGQGGAALQFELELVSLDQLDQFRQRGVRSDEETSDWMHALAKFYLLHRSWNFYGLTERPEAAFSSQLSR